MHIVSSPQLPYLSSHCGPLGSYGMNGGGTQSEEEEEEESFERASEEAARLQAGLEDIFP